MVFKIINENFNHTEEFECDNIWFTSDTHFSQERAFKLSKRDKMFNSVHHMSISIFKNIALIPKDDLLIHLGDIGDKEYMKFILNEHPNTILILGNYEKDEMNNHDLNIDEYKAWLTDTIGFKNVYENFAILDIYGIKFMLTHDPKYFVDHVDDIRPYIQLKDDQDVYCLFGHIHGRQMIKRFGLDVGVDAHHYKPLSFDEVMFYIEAIEKHYDESVFC